jgi:hypothetical protein
MHHKENTEMTIKDRMYGLTYSNAEAMAKMLGGGSIGFAPLQRFKLGSAYNPNRRPLVHCLSDHMLTRHGEAACLNVLPAYENRSRKAREYIAEKAASTNGSAQAAARRAEAQAAAIASIIESTGATATATATAETQSNEDTENMDADTETEAPAGTLEAMMRAIIRKESERAARNGTAGTNAEEVARIATTLIDAAIERAKLPTTTNIVIHRADNTGRVETTDMGIQHDQFPRLLAWCQTRVAGVGSRRVNVWLPGPAGSGKTTGANNVAIALGLTFSYTGALLDETKIFGYMNANGTYVETDFFRAYTQGGVFLWDEADASDPMVSNMLNAAVDGMLASFPHGMFKRHPDFIFIAAANTYGMGANDKYVGRNRLDAATLDRFQKVAWGYCPALEQRIIGDTYAYDSMVRIRSAVEAAGYDVIISTRAGVRHRLMRTMPDLYTATEALENAYRDGMTADQWRQVATKAGFNVGTIRELAA